MKNLITILFIALNMGFQAQETLPTTSFKIDFNTIALNYFNNDSDEWIDLGQKPHLGTAFFYRSDTGYVVTIVSDTVELEPFNMVFHVHDPVERVDEWNSWKFVDAREEFAIYCNSSYRWVYLYSEVLDQYMQFKRY